MARPSVNAGCSGPRMKKLNRRWHTHTCVLFTTHRGFSHAGNFFILPSAPKLSGLGQRPYLHRILKVIFPGVADSMGPTLATSIVSPAAQSWRTLFARFFDLLTNGYLKENARKRDCNWVRDKARANRSEGSTNNFPSTRPLWLLRASRPADTESTFSSCKARGYHRFSAYCPAYRRRYE